MHNIKKNIIAVMIFSLFSLSGYAENNAKQGKQFSLTITVDKLRNNKGNVQFSLYNKDGTIPDKYFKKMYRQAVGKIVNGKSVVTFSNLVPGRYAINILHDENQNKKIDKGLLLPVEGVGFSNYSTINLANRPNFSKASFYLKENLTKSVKVIYF